MQNIAFHKNPEKREWDVVIVGTGMGGAVLGYSLAKAGRSVLFVDKGISHLNSSTSLMGDYAENYLLHQGSGHSNKIDVLSRAGRWFEKIVDISASRSRSFIPFIGSGTGGSTALYGMALERFFPSDFVPKQNYPGAEDTTLPERWPLSYDDLRPYYEAAERLFKVRGTADPLKGNESFDHLLPLPPITPASQELYDFFLSKGLHVYRLPLACEFVPGCECCQSYLCDRDCKNDSARICLKPAIADYGAQLLDECEVLKLEEESARVKRVFCSWHGREIVLRGKIVVLAAGALATPGILLNSVSRSWPNGLANDSGLVGKNLMRHYVDLYAVKPKTRKDFTAYSKEIACNDYYFFKGEKYGAIQSFGAMPPASVIAEGIEQGLNEGRLQLSGKLFKPVKPVVRFFLTRIFSHRLILASIMEDLPYEDNYVALSERSGNPGKRKILLKYQIREYDRKRIEKFRKKISGLLKPYSFMLAKQAENNERIAHACGTCRFGRDPKESVLDVNNRAHGLANLYVVDSSFFPSSGGTNPTLTIAANALRVADHISQNWDMSQHAADSCPADSINNATVLEEVERPGTSLYACTICGFQTDAPNPSDMGTARGNTARFMKTIFNLWKCPRCHTICGVDPVDFQDIYRDYPLNGRRMDFYAKMTLSNLLNRLKRAGVKKTDSILDYGCGNGLFVQFLKQKGYTKTCGYDPYVPEFADRPVHTSFDCVVANDVIEHVSEPYDMVRDCAAMLKPGGLLYIGTTDSEGVEMDNLEPHIMRLHQPFHRIIFSQETLKSIGVKLGLGLINSYRRSYMDTLVPFANYRFLDEFSRALGHNMDLALNPSSGLVLLKRPILWFFAFFGFFFPSAYEPAVILRKGREETHVAEDTENTARD